jgi:hypothetical protein
VANSSGTTSMLWRRLDVPGHDACRLVRESERWRLEGVAAFRQNGAVGQIAYRVTCDEYWRTLDAHVHGSLGSTAVDVGVRRSARGVWILNGEAVPDLHECVDVDLGFTPSTNALQIRRIALEVGQAKDVPVAWLDVAAQKLSVLRQRYERRTETEYWYEAARFDYSGMLAVNEAGFPTAYPGLWEEER